MIILYSTITTSIGNYYLTFRDNRVVSLSKTKLSLFLDISAFDGEATHCPDISRTDYSVAWHHIPEDWNPQLLLHKNLQNLLIYSLIHLKRRVEKVWYEYVKATDNLENPGIYAILTKSLREVGQEGIRLDNSGSR